MSGKADEKIYDMLCRLLGAWVHDIAWEPAETPDYEALFQAADRHLLSAAACFALERAGLMAACPAETAKRFQEAKAQSLRRTILMDAERKELLAFFEKSGIWYMPLKGVVLNGLYPQYGARQFADNDILFDAARWREVRDFMKRRGYRAESVGKGAHDSYEKPPVYRFELHRQLFAEAGLPFLAEAAPYYGDVKGRLVRDADDRWGYHFRDEDFAVYFMAHSYKHYSNGGTGLRTLLDVYLYRRAKPRLDGAYIAGELEKLGLTEFDALFRSLGEKLFGPQPAPELEPKERRMLDRVERSGVYGTLEHRVESQLRALQREQRVSGPRARALYLFRRVFPDMDWYRVNAPFCAEHPWAIPAYWLWLVFHAVFIRGKENLRELKTLCAAPDGQSAFPGAAKAAKNRLLRPFQKPVSRWPLEKRVAKAMRDYERREGHTFDLEHPTLFTEKRVWYGLFFEHPDLTRLYDKYLFKGYIEEKLGPGWTAPLYGMWTRVRDLERDWDRLPDAFVLKSNCSSLGKNVVFVRDRKSVDKKVLFREVKTWLDPMNTGINSCNRAYYGVTPRIMAEKLLPAKGDQLYDYKVMCFGGKADHFLATADRFPREAHNLAYSFYDLAWNKLPVTSPGHENRDIPRPEHLEKMIGVAEKLSQGFPHIRVDFYDTADGLYIGEMTLYSSPAYEQPGFDRRLGERFILPNEVKHEHEEDAGGNKTARNLPVS